MFYMYIKRTDTNIYFTFDENMKLQVVLLFLVSCLFASLEAQWTANGNISTGSGGHKINLGLSHTRGKWTFSGSGWSDFKGGWGAGVGVKLKFRKRAAEMQERFHLTIKVSPCTFDVYDGDDDGVITRQELNLLFRDSKLANTLYDGLNILTDDNGITKEEFDIKASQVIAGCQR